MSLVSNSLILLVWFLVFVIILFLYVDVRVAKLRKELIQHYALCERMVSAIVKQQGAVYSNDGNAYRCDIDSPYSQQQQQGNIFPRVIPAPVDDDLIPSASEMAYGLKSLDHLNQLKHTEFLGSSNLANVPQPAIHAFDSWEFLGGDFAPFRLV